ncbi:hypothetical protein TNCV_1387931 [Trichonephila clavipes]|nr:hypothetical protein TNCV_1387931 [Trichonephila clavipes]
MPFTPILPPDLEALHHHSPPEKKQRPEISVKLSSNQPHLLRCQTLRENPSIQNPSLFGLKSPHSRLSTRIQKKNFYLPSTTPYHHHDH